MSDGQTKPEINWVPLVEAPFKLRFGWDLPKDAAKDDLENDSEYLVSFGLARVRWYRQGFFIQCYDNDKTVCATIPIGMVAYLGMDATLSGPELAAQGKIVSWERTLGAIETAVRLAVLEGQLGLRARKSLDGTFTEVPPSAVPELKFTNWRKGWGEYSTGERLFEIQTGLLKPKEVGHDHTFSRRLLMTVDPRALRQVRPDSVNQSVPALESASIVSSEVEPNKVLHTEPSCVPFQPPQAKAKPGRPVEHDWEGARNFAEQFVEGNGLPVVRQRFIEAVQEWFVKHDGRKAPAAKDIRKNVTNKYYDGDKGEYVLIFPYYSPIFPKCIKVFYCQLLRSQPELGKMDQQKPKRFIRRSVVEAITGLPTSSLYLEITKGRFPKPIPIGERSVAWIEEEVIAWQESRIAERNKSEAA